MTYHQRIVTIRRQTTSGGVSNRDITKDEPGFESKGRDDCDFLIRYEARKWVLRLVGDDLYGI
jgi:hypothetical protein